MCRHLGLKPCVKVGDGVKMKDVQYIEMKGRGWIGADWKLGKTR